jgi:hypothetical protein
MNLSTQDIAVAGLVGGLLVLSAFDATSKGALVVGGLVLAIGVISVWKTGALTHYLER